MPVPVPVHTRISLIYTNDTYNSFTIGPSSPPSRHGERKPDRKELRVAVNMNIEHTKGFNFVSFSSGGGDGGDGGGTHAPYSTRLCQCEHPPPFTHSPFMCVYIGPNHSRSRCLVYVFVHIIVAWPGLVWPMLRSCRRMYLCIIGHQFSADGNKNLCRKPSFALSNNEEMEIRTAN